MKHIVESVSVIWGDDTLIRHAGLVNNFGVLAVPPGGLWPLIQAQNDLSLLGVLAFRTPGGDGDG